MAKHNAAIYGVKDSIEWIHGDCLQEIPKLKVRKEGIYFYFILFSLFIFSLRALSSEGSLIYFSNLNK